MSISSNREPGSYKPQLDQHKFNDQYQDMRRGFYIPMPKIPKYFKGTLVIIGSMISGILMTLIYDYLVQKYGHEDRFAWMFGVGGGLIAFVSIITAFKNWTDNFKEF